MATHPLFGVAMKLKHAYKRLETLHADIRLFLNSLPAAYTVSIEPHRQHIERTRVNVADLQVFGGTLSEIPGFDPSATTALASFEAVDEVQLVVRERKPAPLVDWGIGAGEIAHLLRSALDNIVWAIAVAENGQSPPLPIPRNSPWRDLGFPIVYREEHWHDVSRRKLWGIGSGLTPLFKKVQPFFTGQESPEREPLSVLHELWTEDKHHAPHVVTDLLELAGIDSKPPIPGMGQMDTRVLERRALGPVEDGTELAVVQIVSPTMPIDAVRVSMNANLSYRFDVAFEEGPPAYGGGLIQTLDWLYDAVNSVFFIFEGHMPKSSEGASR